MTVKPRLSIVMHDDANPVTRQCDQPSNTSLADDSCHQYSRGADANPTLLVAASGAGQAPHPLHTANTQYMRLILCGASPHPGE
jgi:hypothetical protein